MSLSESHSGNNSINNNNDSNKHIRLNSFTKNLKKCFNSLKSGRDISKLSKNRQKNVQKGYSKSKSFSSSFSKSKNQEKGQTQTPIEFFGGLQEIVKKENKKKIEEENEKEIIRKNEEKRLKEELMKEKKRNEKIALGKEKYESFWKKVKYYIDKKNEHLSEIAYKIKLRNIENEKINSITKVKMNKTSILLYPKSRKPLYRYKNLNDKLLNKELQFFYNFCQKEIRDNKIQLYKTPRYIQYNGYDEEKNYESENKYQKFYEKKLMWLKKRADKIELRRKYIDKKDKSFIKSFSFNIIIFWRIFLH